MEVQGLDVDWAQPKDITAEGLLTLVRNLAPTPHIAGINVFYGDVAVRFVRVNRVDEAALRVLMMANGGELVALLS